MGQMFTTPTYDYTQASEVSPGSSREASPNEHADLIRAQPGRFRGRDPRSISQEVDRTPIQLEKAEASPLEAQTEASPSDNSSGDNWINKKIQALSLDPRSPSGIPRTPIMIQESPESRDGDQDSETTPMTHKKPPLRGHRTNLPVSKLSFSPKSDDDRQTPERDEKENARPLSTIRPKLESPRILIENPSSPILAKDSQSVVVERQPANNSRTPLMEANIVEAAPRETELTKEALKDTTFAPQVNSTVLI